MRHGLITGRQASDVRHLNRTEHSLS